MAKTEISLKNVAIPAKTVIIRDLNDASIPTATTTIASDTNSFDSIKWSFDLYDAVSNDEILIVIDGVELTKEESLQWLKEGLFSIRIASSVSTTDATPTEIGKIDTLADNSTHLIEVNISCKDQTNVKYGVWSILLAVTKFSGVVLIRQVDTNTHKSSSGLNASSVSFSVNGGDIDIDVVGIAATNIQWNSNYEVLIKSTN